MRVKIVAGNWKMNREKDTARSLVEEILQKGETQGIFSQPALLKVVVCPPFILIPECTGLFRPDLPFYLGAQNCYYEPKGAFTGETSVAMLKPYGVSHVILGHSERRQYFNEDHELIHRKLKAVIAEGLCPIFCCGERIEERKAGTHFQLVEKQLKESVFNLEVSLVKQMIIAYEPVWAIGTGLTASPEQAQEMHHFIRGLFEKQYGNELAAGLIILYGGSCNASNAFELFSQPDVDGGLIGGASLKADDFVSIAKAALDINKKQV